MGFLVEQTAIGPITRIDRLDDGRVMCCMCMGFFWPRDLFCDHDGQIWDYCWGCAAFEHPTTLTWPG